MSLDQCRNIAVVRSNDQIAFPMAWYGAIFNRRRAITDRYRILDLAQLQALLRCMAGPTDGARAAQALLKFFLQNTTGLRERPLNPT